MVVILDVDGTLTLTSELDAAVFTRTFQAVTGKALPTTDWSRYRNATDQGIAEEAIEILGLAPTILGPFRQAFVEALRSELARSPARPVHGAPWILEELCQRGHAVAIATGAWEEAARLKLESAGVDPVGCLLVGSDGRPAREEVVRTAWDRFGTPRGAVYVGDAVWDLRAARTLGLGFVGMDLAGDGALAKAGARVVVRGLYPVADLIAALERARRGALRMRPRAS
jgi:phosphoglycolate phosphatase-like HAD superfamily hydrolase